MARKTLSRSVLETLSIIAYKQPITRGEIEAIKGVSADYSLQTLLQRKLIQSAGRKQALGRPTPVSYTHLHFLGNPCCCLLIFIRSENLIK